MLNNQPETAKDLYNRRGVPGAVEFRISEAADDCIIISARDTGRDIGMLVPTPEGFRLLLAEDLDSDVGGGLIVVWNRDPVSMRFDVVTTSQADLKLQGGT